MHTEPKTYFPHLGCNSFYSCAKILTSRVLLIYIYFIHIERCCKENYLINFFKISVSFGAFPCCLFPLSVASNRSSSFQGWSLVIPSLSTSYFLRDNSYFQISSRYQLTINTCQIFKQVENVLFLQLGRNPQQINLLN